MTYKAFGENLEIYVKSDFLSKTELELLDKEIELANTNNLWSNPEGNTTDVDTWDGRTYFPENSEVLYPITQKVIDFYDKNIRSIENLNDVGQIFTALGPINRTKQGESLPAHDDLGPPEINAPVEYGVVIYLNDNFEGGELYYSEKNLTIHPKRGMLVIHGATKEYTHGVSEVTSGVRYGLTMFINRPDAF